jgi:hypothetical protein
MEATCSSETLITTYQTTRYRNSEDHTSKWYIIITNMRLFGQQKKNVTHFAALKARRPTLCRWVNSPNPGFLDLGSAPQIGSSLSRPWVSLSTCPERILGSGHLENHGDERTSLKCTLVRLERNAVLLDVEPTDPVVQFLQSLPELRVLLKPEPRSILKLYYVSQCVALNS